MASTGNQRVGRIERELVRREHRPLQILLNVWNYGFNKSSPFCWSARWAAIFWVLFKLIPAAMVIIGVGLSGWVAVILAYKANSLLNNQNKLVDHQNTLIDADIKSQLFGELTSILSDISALENQLALESRPEVLKRWPASELDGLALLPEHYYGRISSISRNLHPYGVLNDLNDQNGSPDEAKNNFRKTSPERGYLLVSLFSMRFSLAPIRGALDLQFADLQGHDFRSVNLSGLNLQNSDFRDSNLQGASFGDFVAKINPLDGTDSYITPWGIAHALQHAKIEENKKIKELSRKLQNAKQSSNLFSITTKLNNADFRGADLRNSFLAEAELDGADFRDANLEGAFVTKTWLHDNEITIDSYWHVVESKVGVESIFRLQRK